jgi:hypothetical protein
MRIKNTPASSVVDEVNEEVLLAKETILQE